MASWYAIKVYYNRVQPLIAECKEARMEFFAPTDIIKSLLFVRCTEAEVLRLVAESDVKMWVYRNTEGTKTATILELLGDDKPEYHIGDRVVVTGSPFKGAEGHIKRIKRDRRLVVTIPGIVAVATTYIHPSLLSKVDE